MTLIYGLAFLLLLAGGTILLLIYALKKKSKIGLAIAILVALVILFFLFTNVIDQYSISKGDVLSDLKHVDIELKDEFKIIDNKVTGMPERIQETKVLLTSKDRERIINIIKNASNFTIFSKDEDSESLNAKMDTTYNIKYPQFYSREIYTRVDNYPTRIFLSVDENSDTIRYQRIED